MDVKNKTATSNATATANNSTATATLSAPGVGLQYYITGYSASFAGAAPPAVPALCTVTIGGVVRRYGVGGSVSVNVELDYPVPSGSNGAASIALAAGGAGADGYVQISGFIGPSTLDD